MALALKLNEEGFGGLDEVVKTLYVKGDNGYTLDVSGLPEPEDVSGLKNTIAKLKDEKTAAQRKTQESIDEVARIAREKAESSNDFEALFKSSEAAREKSDGDLESLRQGIKTEKVNTASMLLAGKMADKDNAELLSTFLKPRLTIVDGETKVLDSAGQLTVSTQDDLMKEFAASGKYDSLLRGNGSGGGGAVSDVGGGAATKEITRTEFDAMPGDQRMKHAKEGGKIIDD